MKYSENDVKIYLSNPRIDYRNQAYDVVNNLNFIGNSKVSGPYLNIFNAYAVNFMHEQGFDIVSLSFELNKNEIVNLLNNYQNLYQVKPNVMVMVYGYYEVMITKHCLINKTLGLDKKGCNECYRKQYYLKDKNNRYPLIDDGACNLKILNDKPVILIDYIRELKKLGVNNFLLDFSIENNITDIINSYLNAFNDKDYELNQTNSTLGHFTEGVM